MPAEVEYTVKADFRKYACCEDSIMDRAAYFISAKNGANLRYPGINKLTTYKDQISLIKSGGYATDVNYVKKLTELVERWHLNQYDNVTGKPSASTSSSNKTQNKADTAKETDKGNV